MFLFGKKWNLTKCIGLATGDGSRLNSLSWIIVGDLQCRGVAALVSDDDLLVIEHFLCGHSWWCWRDWWRWKSHDANGGGNRWECDETAGSGGWRGKSDGIDSPAISAWITNWTTASVGCAIAVAGATVPAWIAQAVVFTILKETITICAFNSLWKQKKHKIQNLALIGYQSRMFTITQWQVRLYCNCSHWP